MHSLASSAREGCVRSSASILEHGK
uniref:Uncharacterized protein n=1 Tax=Arundo donax TaxID=35708 RepID=A0A0A8Z6N2_ARUDO